MQLVYDEWKEVAQRIDLVLFMISLVVVTVIPIVLFSKYAMKINEKLVYSRTMFKLLINYLSNLL